MHGACIMVDFAVEKVAQLVKFAVVEFVLGHDDHLKGESVSLMIRGLPILLWVAGKAEVGIELEPMVGLFGGGELGFEDYLVGVLSEEGEHGGFAEPAIAELFVDSEVFDVGIFLEDPIG